MPREVGLGGNLWDGKTLAAWIANQYGIELGVRQCQRLFRQLGFRLRKPRPSIAQADPEQQKAHKETPGIDGRSIRGSLGHRRSALPAAWIAVPNVDSSGGQRSGAPSRSYAAQRWILCGSAVAGWEVSILPGNKQVQRRDLLYVYEEPSPDQHPHRSPRGRDHRAAYTTDTLRNWMT